MRVMKKKNTNMRFFLVVIFLAIFLLTFHQNNKFNIFSFKIKDPQIFIGKAGGKIPLELEKNFYFSIQKLGDTSIIWAVDGGTIEYNDAQATWNLPASDGIYTVVVYKKSGQQKLGKDELSVRVAVDPDLAVPHPVVVHEYPIDTDDILDF